MPDLQPFLMVENFNLLRESISEQRLNSIAEEEEYDEEEEQELPPAPASLDTPRQETSVTLDKEKAFEVPIPSLDEEEELSAVESERAPTPTLRSGRRASRPLSEQSKKTSKKRIEKFSFKTGKTIDSYQTQTKAAQAVGAFQPQICKAIQNGTALAGFGWRLQK
jgi:hypothetical protein